jgi:type I restriction enzyme S subunit
MEKFKIGQLTTIINGSTPSTINQKFWDGNIPWITPKDLSDFKGRFIEKGERNITELGYKSCSTVMVPKDSILLTSRAPIGYLAISANPLCTNQGFKTMICNKRFLLPLYLFYFLSTKVNYLKSISGGATFNELSKTVLSNVEISLPSIPEQKHIVDARRQTR